MHPQTLGEVAFTGGVDGLLLIEVVYYFHLRRRREKGRAPLVWHDELSRCHSLNQSLEQAALTGPCLLLQAFCREFRLYSFSLTGVELLNSDGCELLQGTT